jgi:O-antigen ligase
LNRYANAALETCWLIVVALAPLYVDLLRAHPFTPRILLVEILATLMVVLWLIHWMTAPRAASPAAQRRLPFPLLLLAIAFGVTTVTSAVLSPLASSAFWGEYVRADGAYVTLSYLVFFLVAADRLQTRAQLDRLVTVLLAASLPVCLYGLLQVRGLDPVAWQQVPTGRVASTVGNPIFLAAYLVMLMPLTLWRLQARPSPEPSVREAGRWGGIVVLGAATLVVGLGLASAAVRPQIWWAAPWLVAAFALVAVSLPPLPWTRAGEWTRRVAYAALLALQALVLVFTASIGPLLALAGAALVAAVLILWRQRRWRYLIGIGSAVLLLGAFVAVLNIERSPLESLERRAVLLRRVGNLHDTGAMLRLLVWQSAAQALANPQPLGPAPDWVSPLRPLVGYGQETIPYLLNRVLPPPRVLDNVIGEVWDRSHNALLDRLLTTGILGLAAYIGLIGGVLLVAFRRARDELDARSWGPRAAILLALLVHVLETQFSMLVVPGEAIFWLLAGAAVGAWRSSDAEVLAPQAAPSVERDPVASPPRRPWRAWALYAFVGLGLLVAVVLGVVSAPGGPLAMTVASLIPLVLAPCVGALILAPPTPREGGAATGPPLWQALAPVGLAGVAALVLNVHQVTALAADVAFREAELAQQRRDAATTIRASQEAIRLAPDQPYYYSQLGGYYATIAGRTRIPGQATVDGNLATALSVADPARLDRDQLFLLGQISLEEALRRNPLDVRHYIALAELQRYWSEVDQQPTHLTAAIENFARAASLKPNDVEVHAGTADCLLLAGDPRGAVAAGLRATELLPTYWYPYSVLARAYLALGEPAEAHAAAQAGLDYARGVSVKPASAFELQRMRLTADAAQEARRDGSPAHTDGAP